jgi:outer membrane protein OmpA-like peptidoglycan-associated protein
MVHLDFQRLYALEMIKLNLRHLVIAIALTGCREKIDPGSLDFEGPPAVELEDLSINPARCSYQDCVCKVEIPEYTPVYKAAISKLSDSVYFEEEEFLTGEDDYAKVHNFMSKNQDSEEIFILGYTDGCGSYFYNQSLSKKRARSALSLVRRTGYRKKVIYAGMSELTSTHEPNARRADIISSKNLTYKVPPPNLVADVYLLDASGSMGDYSAWLNIIAANKKTSSRLYISYTMPCADGTRAENVSPSGPTEIWWSYWQTLDKMKPGQSLIILSDFDSRIPLTSREHIRLTQKARSRGVKVYAVQL